MATKQVLKKQVSRAFTAIGNEARYHLRPKPRRLLFDHMFKCGGSSLTYYLRQHYPTRKVFMTDVANLDASVATFRALTIAQRHAYKLIIGHCADALIDSSHPGTITATLLRDPVDRIISHYFYASENPEHHLYPMIHGKALTLEDYATSGISAELSNWYTLHYSGMGERGLKDHPTEASERAIHRLLTRYQLIGFLNCMPEFISALRRKARLARPFDNIRRNFTKQRVPLEQVPESTKRAIMEVNALDIALWNVLLAKRSDSLVIENSDSQ